jgi:hypothetical protein
MGDMEIVVREVHLLPENKKIGANRGLKKTDLYPITRAWIFLVSLLI